jgi:RNA polymerase sigma factor (sigma-70 family)
LYVRTAERAYPHQEDRVAAVPSIGRATRVEPPSVPGAAAAGDLYERYSPQILGYCLHQLGSREEAEDAVQTTFMNAFRGLQRGIVPELESAWLFKIAHNVCLSRRRSSWRRGRVEAPNNFEVLQEIVPGREQVADELIRLQDVLEEMPESQRRAILLREWQGLTYREISDELGLSQAAVETLIFRARRALAQGLEQDADTWKKRLRRGADAGGGFACVKTLLGGGGAAAMKIGATAAVVATAAVAAATPAPKKQPQVHRTARAKTTVASPAAPRTRRSRTPARAVGSAPRRATAASVKAKAPARAHASALQPTAASASSSAVLPAPSDTPIAAAPAPSPAPAQTESTTASPPAPAPLDAPPTPQEQPLPPTADPPAPGTQGNKPDLPPGADSTKPDHPDHPDNGHGNAPK